MSINKILFIITAILVMSIMPHSFVYAQNESKIDSLRTLISDSKTETERIDLVLSLAQTYRSQIPDTTISLALNMKSLSDKLKYSKGQYLSRRILAQTYAEISKYNEAIVLSNEAKIFLVENPSQYEEALLLRIMASVYSDLGELDKASNFYFESLKICETLGDKPGMSSSYNGIGKLFYERKDVDMALKYYTKSLELSRTLNDQEGISRGLNNIAIVYSLDDKYDKVIPLMLQASVINKSIGKRLWEGINYLNIGENYRINKLYDSSVVYYFKADTIFRELRHYKLLANTYISISKFYNDIDNESESIRYGQMALDLSNEKNFVLVQNAASKWLYELYTIKKEDKLAFKYGLIHFQLKDSLEMEKSAARLSQMELLYQFEKKDQQRIAEKQRREAKYIISILSLIFIAVLIVILILARQRIKTKNNLLEKRRLEAEIEIKDRELVVNVMSLLKKNEVLASIVDNLMLVHDKAVKDETKTALIKIAKDIQKSSEVEIWEEFEVRFKQAHGDYYNRLNSKFPNLTPNELKLSAFLKLNMSSKDISELTGQSVSSIEVARTRLRKKLGITNTKTNLISYISQI